MTTLVDVARVAGISTATVSRVLNNHPKVDPRLAAEMRQAVKELGDRPSRVARSLRTRRNQGLGAHHPRREHGATAHRLATVVELRRPARGRRPDPCPASTASSLRPTG
ncbi:MAG: LacI family DNA-binding transcriptional regulator [Acidimicrobiales bacterium]